MCGICGYTGQKDKEDIKKMSIKLNHRGPDQEGLHIDNKISMASRRLSIVDIDGGIQPIYNENKQIVCVWNGEIYNYVELRNKLKNNGHIFNSDSDSEVIVHLYEEYEENFLQYLNGMFSIALWDSRKDKLVLARDRVGKKPLFYCIFNEQIIFASEIKALFEYSGVIKDIDYEAIYHYFSFKNIPSPFTAFKNIKALEPGSILTYQNGRIEIKRYWEINFTNINNMISYEDNKKDIYNLLYDSVSKRVNCDVEFGVFLSGGIDSSIVALLASEITGIKFKTFSLGYTTKYNNKEEDLYYARKIAKSINSEHYEYLMTPDELISDLSKVIGAFDQPFSGTISTYFLSKIAKEHVKVILTGDGADELFGSYLGPRLAWPMYYYEKIIKKNGYIPEWGKSYLKPFEKNLGYLEKLYHYSKGKDYLWRYYTLLFKDEDKIELFNKSNFSHFFNHEITKDMLKEKFEAKSAIDPLNSILEFDFNTLLPDQVLAFVDFLSMAHSIEIRCPFMDYRLVEYVSKISGKRKIQNGIVKKLLKETLKDYLPDSIIERKKEGFVLPIFEWLRNDIKNYVFEILDENRVNRTGILNSKYIRKLLDNYYTNNDNNYDLAAKIWNILCFQIWYENYLI